MTALALRQRPSTDTTIARALPARRRLVVQEGGGTGRSGVRAQAALVMLLAVDVAVEVVQVPHAARAVEVADGERRAAGERRREERRGQRVAGIGVERE